MAHNRLPHLSTKCKLFQIEMSIPIFDSVYKCIFKNVLNNIFRIFNTSHKNGWSRELFYLNEENCKRRSLFHNVPYLGLWVSIFKKEWLESEVTQAICQSGLVLWGVWVVLCSFGGLLWSVHEGEEEQSHVIRAPIGCVWGHGWPVAALD